MSETVGTAESAIRWALQEYGNEPEIAVAFLRDWQSGKVATAMEWSEYRYWVTGIHETTTDQS